MNRGEQARFGWVAFAILIGAACDYLRGTNPFLGESYRSVVAYGTIVMPIGLVYAILRHHLIDIRFVISRGIVYATITSIIVGIIGFVDWLTSIVLSQARFALVIDAGVTVGLSFILHRVSGAIESAIDSVIFRKKREAETYLRRMAKALLRAKDEGTVDRALVEEPYEALELASAALYRWNGSSYRRMNAEGSGDSIAPRFDEEHALVRFLKTERTRLNTVDLRDRIAQEINGGGEPTIVYPLFLGESLIAFTVYGLHRDGTRLDPDEIELLERLCDLAAQAYTSIALSRYQLLEGGLSLTPSAAP